MLTDPISVACNWLELDTRYFSDEIPGSSVKNGTTKYQKPRDDIGDHNSITEAREIFAEPFMLLDPKPVIYRRLYM